MHNQLNFRGVTKNNVNAGLAAGTTSTYTTTAATVTENRGYFGTALAAQTNTATPTTDAATGLPFVALAPNKATVLVWGINAAGAIQVAQGGVVDTQVGLTTTVGAFRDAPQFPTIPDDFVPIAYSLHRTAPAAASWIPGTGAWAASGVSSTFRNVSTLPERPQIS